MQISCYDICLTVNLIWYNMLFSSVMPGSYGMLSKFPLSMDIRFVAGEMLAAAGKIDVRVSYG